MKMKSKTMAVCGVLVLVVSMAIMNVMPVKGSSTLEVGSGKPYTTIQSAVDAATSGDTILVYPGTYTESVYVWKPLTIESTDGPAVTIVDDSGGGWGANGFNVIASYVTIDGFTVYGPDPAGSPWTNFNTAPIMIGGLYPGDPYHLNVNHVTVRKCILIGWTGIYNWKSSDNMIVNNEILNPQWDAIQIYDGSSDIQIVYYSGVNPTPGSNVGGLFAHPCGQPLANHGYLQTWDGIQLYPSDGDLISPSQNNKIINNDITGQRKTGIFVGAWNVDPDPVRTDNTGTKVHGNKLHDPGTEIWAGSIYGLGTAFSDGSKKFSGNNIGSGITPTWAYQASGHSFKGNPTSSIGSFDAYSYNYDATVFVGPADGVDRTLDGAVCGDSAYAGWMLVMKWQGDFGADGSLINGEVTNHWIGPTGEYYFYKMTYDGTWTVVEQVESGTDAITPITPVSS